MPRPRRSNLSQRSRNAIRQRNIASNLSDEEREIAREKCRVSMAQRRALIRASQTQEQREAARETARLETRNRRAYRTAQRNNLRSARRNGTICQDSKTDESLLDDVSASDMIIKEEFTIEDEGVCLPSYNTNNKRIKIEPIESHTQDDCPISIGSITVKIEKVEI